MQRAWLSERTEVRQGATSETLQASRVAVIGLGGVGSAAAWPLPKRRRHLMLVDGDVHSTIHRNRHDYCHSRHRRLNEKSAVCAARLALINPDCAMTHPLSAPEP
jgi:tRNA A37 threonylcarbamoyladenosine dehydratase